MTLSLEVQVTLVRCQPKVAPGERLSHLFGFVFVLIPFFTAAAASSSHLALFRLGIRDERTEISHHRCSYLLCFVVCSVLVSRFGLSVCMWRTEREREQPQNAGSYQ